MADYPMIDLLPCPFCKCDSVRVYVNFGGLSYVGCSDCDSYGPEKHDAEQAMIAWNTRPCEDGLQADADAFRETLVDNEAYCASMSAQLAALQAENKRLREVIGMVEFVRDDWFDELQCPWCEHRGHDGEPPKHSPTCQRQEALKEEG